VRTNIRAEGKKKSASFHLAYRFDHRAIAALSSSSMALDVGVSEIHPRLGSNARPPAISLSDDLYRNLLSLKLEVALSHM
jgi:hypothetical protein